VRRKSKRVDSVCMQCWKKVSRSSISQRAGAHTTHLNFHCQLLGHTAHLLIPNKRLLLETEKDSYETLYAPFQCVGIPCVRIRAVEWLGCGGGMVERKERR
jgi:hypothetical protein